MSARRATGLTRATSRRRRCRSGRRSARPRPVSTPSSGRERSRRTAGSRSSSPTPTASGFALGATGPPAIRRSGATTPTSRTGTRTRPGRSARLSPGRTTRTRPILRRLRRAPSATPAPPTTWHPSWARPRDARRSSPGRHSRARTATSSWSPRTRTSATSSTRGSRESRPTRRATASSRRPTATRRPPSTGLSCRRVTRTEPPRSRSTYRTPPRAPSRSSRRLPA